VSHRYCPPVRLFLCSFHSAGVKRKMADCRLHLEAARFEAEKVVTRLLRDHEAWGQVSCEGRPKEKAPDNRVEPRSRREADNPAKKALLVRFGSLRLERNDAGAGDPEEERPRSSKSIREGRHATSTPTGSDREQRLKDGPKEISGIRGVHLPPPAPQREVSPGRSSSRRMYPSPTESSEDEYDSYSKRDRGRKAEGRSSSPRPRRSDERHGRDKWDRPERRREESPEDREPPSSRRAVPPRPGRPRSSSREKGYTDSQRDVNKGTINVLRSMQAKLMTLQGQTGKNSGYPYFDRTLKDYPKFRRRWHTFQDLYHKATLQRELVNLFRENCLEKKVADRLRCEETMAGCWRVLDPFYSRPTQYAQDLMSEITASKRIQHSEYERLFEYYALLRGNITEARKANLMEALLTQANIALMEQPLPAREIEEWRSHQARYAPRYHADAFVEFVDDREEWALKNVAYSTAPSSHNSNNDNQKGRKSYEKKEAKVMAVKAVAKKEPHFPPPKRWSPDHPWGRPCIADECREEHAPPSCALFKGKTPDERLAVVPRRELCILCFRHLDTKRCWSLGKVDICNVRGCGRAHNYLLHDVLQNEEVLMVSALPGRVSEPESVVRCRQMVAAENEGQCFRLNVLYDWGATVSMISEEAVEVMGLSTTKQTKRIIKGLGGATTVSKGNCTLSLVARNGDRKTVTAWEVGEIASLPGGQPPEEVDEQFSGL
jgi:hypothetical protein